MAQPTPYIRAYNLASVQSGNSLIPIPGSYLDTELDAVKTTLDQTLANLALIQRDDGALKNEIVTVSALSSDVKALMAAGANIEGPWVTATVYDVGAIVEESSIAYMCLEDHTSGTFATDLSNGKWVALTSSALVDASVTTAKINDLAVTTAKLAAGAVTFAKIQNITADRLLGRDTTGAGSPEELTVSGGLEFTGTGGIQRSALTGDVTANVGSNATTIADAAVSNAKMANMSQASLKGRLRSAGTGAPTDITISQALDMLGAAEPVQGDIAYKGASGWTRLPAGTDGQYLKTQGSAANPTWADGPVAQTKSSIIGSSANGSTAIPYDDTTPTSSEGTEFLTLEVTPKNGSNTLEIEVQINLSYTRANSSDAATVALYSGTTCIATSSYLPGIDALDHRQVVFTHRFSPSNTDTRTFSVRAGTNSGTAIRMNGSGGTRLMGGVMRSGIIVREYAV